ncbi:hypothetical protein ACOSQ2_028666 [Xanthoceras sorbifolium]
MDEVEIAKLCESLSLSDKDGPIATMDNDLKKNGVQKLALSLVGKVITNKVINREAFRSVIPKIWKTSQGVDIEALGNNTFVFSFRNSVDRKRIMAGGPWNFDRSLIVLEEPKDNGVIGSLKFTQAEFWVQVHNVPLVCMTREIGLFLGRKIGAVRELDLGATGDCMGKFLRIRVLIDISKSLRRCIRVALNGTGKATTMLLHYERLPEFCSQCGFIGHATRECIEVDQEALVNPQEFEYGS